MLSIQRRMEELEKKVQILEQEVVHLRNNSLHTLHSNTDEVPETDSSATHQDSLHTLPLNASTNITAPLAHEKKLIDQFNVLHGRNEQASITATPKEPIDWEHLLARIWLPRIFIIVLLLGVLWGFSAAVRNGILTEPLRCILGLMVAAIMFWYGEVQYRHKRSALAQVLLGGSIAILILTLFAAHMLYGLIPAPHSFVLYLLSIGAGVFTAIRHRSQTLLIVTMLGGFMVPFLIRSTVPNTWVFVGYETLFSVTMLILSSIFAYRIAHFTAIGLLHIPLFFLFIFLGNQSGSVAYAFITGATLQYITIFVIALLQKNRDIYHKSIVVFSGFLLLTGWASMVSNRENLPMLFDILIGLWAGIFTLTALWKHVWKENEPVYLAAASYAWFIWLSHILGTESLYMAWTMEGFILLLLAIRSKSPLQQISGCVIYSLGLMGTLSTDIRDIASYASASWIILIATLIIMLQVIRRRPHLKHTFIYHSYIWFWLTLFIILLFTKEMSEVFTWYLSTDTQHLVLSSVWAAYAVVMIVIGVLFQHKYARLAGILLLLLTLLKLILIDIPGVSLPIRAILFIGLGAIGIIISRLLYRKQAIQPPADPPATR
ncbi:putative membrane protein [Paenibacillus shirakamiensis]|uniref:Membrane protein n=1 Tax=Paenibacillus shirakamiensis TaxID=1265935 RepID=A0ABS4JG91_9BACL|nr:DUF2339 domain-containing protein [Paenibacillus shirakamiensis]MBP2000733.1 putative membrane protein [Paenibacillus shirakamiensis]